MSQTALDLAIEGETCRLRKDYRKAISFFRQAIRKNDKYAWAYAHLGSAQLNRHGREVPSQDARENLEIAIALRQDHYPWAIAKLGQYWFESGNYPKAIEEYTKALKQSPGYSWALAHRGWAYYRDSQYEPAYRDFTAAIQNTDNEYAFAYAMRAATSGKIISQKESKIPEMRSDTEKLEAYKFILEKYHSVTADILQAIFLNKNIYDRTRTSLDLSRFTNDMKTRGIAVGSHQFSLRFLEEVRAIEDAARSQKTP
ncbi:tetratricopeptide repeat protein [Roseofilum reptotaenium]|nr:tetratricopeptide repeat protein [Roseofilum reptotaenium]